MIRQRRSRECEAGTVRLRIKERLLLLCFLLRPALAFVPRLLGETSSAIGFKTSAISSFQLTPNKYRWYSSESRISRPFLGSSTRLPASVASDPAKDEAVSPLRYPYEKKRRRNTKRYEIRQLFRKAKSLERKGQWRKAANILSDILAWEPKDAHSHLALARLEARRSPETNAALKAFDRGTRVCPKSIHLWQAWAVYEESRGNSDRARELFDQALDLDPYNPYVCHAYGLMERKLGNTEAARKLWERALQKNSTAALVCQMGELLIAENELNEARDLYMRHLSRLETDREKTEVYLASAWLEERYFENYDRAEELIKLSLVLNPTSSLAQVALARLEGRRRQRLQGEEVGTATVRRLATACIGIENGSAGVQPEDGRVYNAWAHFEIKNTRFSAARKILKRGVERYPEDYSLLQAAGKVEERVGNYSGARDLYSASLRIQPSAPTLVAYALLDLRQPEIGTANFTKVERLFEEALLIDPRHGPAYNSYGNTELRRGDVEKARTIFERGVGANCFDAASVYHGYAKLELSLGNVKKARELLLQGRCEAHTHDLSMDSPHRERALFLTHTLGMLELNSNRPSDALEIFSDGIERYGNSSQLLLGAALSEVKLGNEDKARKLFERSVTVDRKHAQAWQAWGVMEMRAGNWKTAKTLYECGIKSAPKHGALWLAYAIAEGRLANVDTSRKLFAKGIKNAPRHVPLYQAWASLELREGNFSAAKTLIGEALTLDKSNGSGWLIAAEIEGRLENTGLVNLILRRGIECAPTFAELYRSLGDSLVRRGNIDEARQIFEKGIAVDPLHAPLYHSLAELEARVCNVQGLAELNKRTAEVFHTNALEPPVTAGEEAWGTKIKASRSRSVPKGIGLLAQRIVEDEETTLSTEDVDPNAFIDEMSAGLMEAGVGNLLINIDEEPIASLDDITAKNKY